MEIETLGSAGLRYRRRGKHWKEVDAFSIRRTVDTSGAGDWCTAGILHLLCQDGIHGLQRITDQDALAAVRLGQAMAAWTCQFEGARGGMYGVAWEDWKKAVLEIIKSGSTDDHTMQQLARVCPAVLLDVCRPGFLDHMNQSVRVPHQTGAQVCTTLWPGGDVGKALPRRT